MNDTVVQPTYAFEGFRLDAQRRVLSRANGEPIPLTPKALDTLLYLVEHRGELLDKRGLLEAVWPHVCVEENNLNQTISALRRVLGERPGERRFIATEPGRGYRFVASATVLPAPPPSDESKSLGEGVTVEHSGAFAEQIATAEPGAAALNGENGRRHRGAPTRRTGVYVAAVSMLFAAFAGWLAYVARPDDDAALPNSIAVLPFANLSPNPDDAFFAAGLHAEILNRLAKVPGLNVIGLASVSRYSDPGQSVRDVAAELGAQNVLTADVRYDDARTRVTARLMDGKTGRVLWIDTFQRELDDVFAIESEIAAAIAAQLGADGARQARQRIGAASTDSAGAYLAYLRAQDVRARSSASGLVLEYLDEAVRLDPQFAEAHAQKAYYYAARLISVFGNTAASSEQAELERLTRESAEAALRLDASSWLAHQALGEMHERFWRWTEARTEYEQAARSTPDGTWRAYDYFAAMTGDSTWQEAIRRQRRVIELNPQVAEEHWILALFHAYSGDARATAAEAREAVNLDPGNALFHAWVAHAEGMVGRSVEALKELRRAEELPGVYDSSTSLAHFAYAYAQNGQHDDAARFVARLASKAPDRRFEAGNWALAYLAVGDRDSARAALETVIEKIAREEPDGGFLALRLIRFNVYSDPVLEQQPFRELRAQLRGK